MNWTFLAAPPTVPIDSTLSEAMGEAIGALGLFVIILMVIGLLILIGVVALITWVVKKVWYAGRKPEHRQEQDWLTQAQMRQQNKYAYSDPVKTQNVQKRNSTPKEVYDHTGGKWSPTGWYFNPKTGLWEPPDYLSKTSKKRK